MLTIKADAIPKFAGIPAVVLGNGPSRLRYDIEALAGRCILFGCNKFGYEYTGKGPLIFGACDETIYELFFNKKDILKRNLLLAPKHHEFFGMYDLPYIEYFKDHAWGTNTGFAMLQAAKLFGCSPIFFCGFSDNPIKLENNRAVDNVYGRPFVNEIGITYFEDVIISKVARFTHELKILIKKDPQLYYRIGDHSQLLKDIQFVEYNDLLESLPMLDLRAIRHEVIFKS